MDATIKKTPAYAGPIPDEPELNKMLDKITKEVFLHSDAAFLGSLLCSHSFHWDYDGSTTDTACTDGLNIHWNVNDFMRCNHEERKATLLHELWHTGLMHFLRQGNRDPLLWNMACDFRINNNLRKDNHKIPNNGWWIFDDKYDSPEPLSEEQIYDLLVEEQQKQNGSNSSLPQFKPDMKMSSGSVSTETQANIIGAVVRAVQAAQMANKPGSIPGNVKHLLNQFLEPKINWRAVLYKWMSDLIDEVDYTWSRPHRRFAAHGLYMPSHEEPEGRLEHLVYFLDTSYSITDPDVIRFNSEVKYVQEQLRPQKLTLVQFDTAIQSVREFTEDEPFESIEVKGRGGTSLVPVREWIEKHKPTAAIVFSDMECEPMKPLTSPIPVIWAVIRNRHITVPFGTVIYIANN